MAKSPVRPALVAAAAVAPVLALLAAAPGAHAAAVAPTALPAQFAAPYLQIDSSSAKDMAADQSASGLKNYTLAFLTSKSGCTLQWEDGGDSVGAFSSQINAVKSAGGNVIPSFGGAGSKELAQTCTSVSSLTAAYQKVVSTYGVTRLDFDIEGDTLANGNANARRDQALAALQQADPSVQIDWTVAVDPDGMESDVTTLLKNAQSAGVKTSAVNLMTMDFGDGENALADAESGATAAEKQFASIYGGSAAQNWARMGLTPIAGQNDDDEDFTQANASTLESFAASKGVQELAFWEVDQYDKPTGYAYSKIFNKI
ncbi:glycosyl hydrolase family 18 protein [Streptomyces sp. NBC_00669]|uniref:glycosyl hydrolase family 18 protein n=1 Tax=Streptomyces sp. NBC_00669 TaxID=2976011 RepID=UPI002E2F8542|nr:glycosyl hydrolase family 18 protein [Streptomyces sp. NBC_00669]